MRLSELVITMKLLNKQLNQLTQEPEMIHLVVERHKPTNYKYIVGIFDNPKDAKIYANTLSNRKSNQDCSYLTEEMTENLAELNKKFNLNN